MKKGKIKVALVGCGRISKNHLQAIIAHKNRVDLKALCDNNIDRLDDTLKFFSESFSEKIDVEKFLDYENLIKSIKDGILIIDLIVLATPSGFHSKQVQLAANIGVNVCTEKPMATNWNDGLKMVNACEKAKVKLFVVKQNRLNSTLRLVKSQIENGRFGKIYLVNVNVFWQRPQTYYDQDDWRGTRKLDGGALMNQASHYIDLLDWLIGPVKSLSASIATLGREIEVEDTAVLQISWESGTLGTMSVTMLTYPENLEGSITILGENGTVKIGGKAVNKIEYWKFSDFHDDDLLVEKASYDTTSVYGFGHKPYYGNMVDVLQGISKPECDGREGLKSLELLIAAYRSSKKKEIINLPLKQEL